jgi:hypothetical protein
MSRRRYVVQVVPLDASPQVAEFVPPVQAPVIPQVQPVVEPEKKIPVQSRIFHDRSRVQTQVRDPFEEQEERMRRLFQETKLEEVHEDLSIQKPRSPRRFQEGEALSSEDVFRQNIHFEDQSQKIESFYRQRQQSRQPEREEVITPKKTSNSRAPKVSPGLLKLGFFFIVLLSVIGTSLFAGVTYVKAQVKRSESDVQALLKDVESGQWQSAQERLNILQKRREFAEKGYQIARPVVRTFLGKEKTTSVEQLLDVSQAGLNVVSIGLETQQTFDKGFRQFMDQEDGSSLETLTHVTGQSESLYTELSQLQAQVDQLKNPFELEVVNDLQRELNQNVPKMRRYFAAVQKLGGALPELLGEEGKKQYLVLLQNNMELRPTGGFIGSFGILTVQNGKFLDFRVEDVYEADGQLNGFVTPPPEIVQYLGEARWFLRDVNWNPDFPTTAQQAQWFLEKETGIKADGVIAVNLDVAKKLLEVTGPIELVDYKEVITKDNLYERAQTHSEMNFFPGSTQKRDFLSALANQLFLRLMKGDTAKLGLGQAFLSAADESQIMIALNAPVAAQVFSNLGWDGSIRTPQCPPPFHTQECYVDTVMQVEANVGVNKANQYVKRNIEQTTTLTRETAEHKRVISITNTAKSNAWPEGIYRNYLRLFVPKEAKLSAVQLDGTEIDLRGVKNVEEGGKRVFGLYLEVPIQKTSILTVSYSVPLSEGSPFVYSLFDQKQSGTSGDVMTHIIQSTDRPILTVAPEPKFLEDGKATFASDRVTHDFMAVEVQ